jgi:TonB family protein
MCSSRPNPTEPRLRPDVADRVGSVLSVGWLVVGCGLAGLWLHTWTPAPPPGEVQLPQETHLRIELAPMPEVLAPLPEPVVEPEPIPEPLPEPEPEPAPESQPVLKPEPIPEPEAVPPPVEVAPMQAAQAPMEEEGAQGREEAIRAEWMTQLRRRIEQSKFYPGAARYSRETGTVLLRVEIRPEAVIGEVQLLKNSGSALLAEGAVAILRRAAEQPLGTNRLSSGFQVEVPITYQVGRR